MLTISGKRSKLRGALRTKHTDRIRRLQTYSCLPLGLDFPNLLEDKCHIFQRRNFNEDQIHNAFEDFIEIPRFPSTKSVNTSR
ncbi:hypothetical protein V6N11_015764 [Hibiscus sabdariffa]|uniref:Uncharacterized protein n=1 Tax=Hibiscus sabdariffa TaxID=183260 RepID=A0ABR2TT44_9ROSI